MKHFISFLILFLCISAFAQKDQTLMTVNGKDIPKSYFEYLYKKNNTTSEQDKKSLEEYLDLFTIFELKVAEARAQGMDTVAALEKELSDYRKQLALPYFTDSATINHLAAEEYERMKTDIDVSHILIKIEGTGTPADTLAAYKKALEVKKRLKKEDFETVAKEVSNDPSVAKNGGRLGYLSALLTVYPFETAAYNTPVGQISAPVRTMLGYHILKVNDRREAGIKVQVAHILRLVPDSISAIQAAAIEAEVNAIYKLIIDGGDFAQLAMEYSQDSLSAVKGGVLPWLGRGQTVKQFEDAAFALTTIGQYSQPIETEYGWHILKLIDRKNLDSFETLRPGIEQRMMQTDRAEMIRQAFADSLKKQYDYKINTKEMSRLKKIAADAEWNDSIFFTQIEDSYDGIFETNAYNPKINNAKDFSQFMKDKKLPVSNLDAALENYSYEKLAAYKNSQLEWEYPEFRNLLQEYTDGSLLFNISNREVWEKAAQDTTGLRQYFEANRDKYRWEKPYFKGRVLHCKDEKTAKRVKRILKTAHTDSIETELTRLNKQKGVVVKSERNLFAQGDNNAVDFYIFKEGALQPPADFEIVFVDGKQLDFTPESYTDMKGAVIQDYQDFLEAQWVKSLQAKYPVVINEEVLKTIK
ncbi:MAG: peptidylprolyl isomerase [Prevotellaceae bacterium]|jgi:peptidyl-prolyl cis-trans isomerase SurA|nr:peptidylprolyl isomerase [Prevotellaceae bacterium]